MYSIDLTTIILAFDVGTHNTGVAIYKRRFVQALHTLKHDKTPKSILAAILNDIARYNPNIVILGLPQRGNIKQLVPWLKKQIEIYYPKMHVDTVKEDNTTRYVKDLIIIDEMVNIVNPPFTKRAKRNKLKKAKRRGLIDRNAATVILNQFLEINLNNPHHDT